MVRTQTKLIIGLTSAHFTLSEL